MQQLRANKHLGHHVRKVEWNINLRVSRKDDKHFSPSIHLSEQHSALAVLQLCPNIASLAIGFVVKRDLDSTPVHDLKVADTSIPLPTFDQIQSLPFVRQLSHLVVRMYCPIMKTKLISCCSVLDGMSLFFDALICPGLEKLELSAEEPERHIGARLDNLPYRQILALERHIGGLDNERPGYWLFTQRSAQGSLLKRCRKLKTLIIDFHFEPRFSPFFQNVCAAQPHTSITCLSIDSLLFSQETMQQPLCWYFPACEVLSIRVNLVSDAPPGAFKHGLDQLFPSSTAFTSLRSLSLASGAILAGFNSRFEQLFPSPDLSPGKVLAPFVSEHSAFPNLVNLSVKCIFDKYTFPEPAISLGVMSAISSLESEQEMVVIDALKENLAGLLTNMEEYCQVDFGSRSMSSRCHKLSKYLRVTARGGVEVLVDQSEEEDEE